MSDQVETYLHDLAASLRGPRRVRRGLLEEAAGHLEDATEAHVARGLDVPAAEARALAEFGSVDEVAPAFQTTLAVAASRRAAWAFLLACAPQAFLWDNGARLSERSHSEAPDSPLFAVLDAGIETIGFVVLLGMLLALLGTSVGNRWFRAGRQIASATAVFVMIGAILIPVTAVTMMALSQGTEPVLYGYATVLLGAPMALAFRSARRSLAAASA